MLESQAQHLPYFRFFVSLFLKVGDMHPRKGFGALSLDRTCLFGLLLEEGSCEKLEDSFFFSFLFFSSLVGVFMLFVHFGAALNWSGVEHCCAGRRTTKK